MYRYMHWLKRVEPSVEPTSKRIPQREGSFSKHKLNVIKHSKTIYIIIISEFDIKKFHMPSYFRALLLI